ncbi:MULTISPECIES: GFA family protein [Kordiimonas]|uniref:GFA family protein n=1 Tax=Kordiimonas TaxID=288021 RepID=UPI001FF42D2E|nr:MULTISPECIES: GFA family protein [Kordiimonas]MCK0068775.1 GFA family protein [Kordiimonas laminariae]UTW58126.1 GFA family protein [Kordiimonas sp. SCSIO 12603]
MTCEPLYTGKCLCGAVHVEVYGKERWVGHCHCPSCQKATSAGFATYAGFAAEHVRFSGDTPKIFKSSASVKRSFCGTCGSSIAFEGEAWPDEIHLHVALFENASEFKPEGHAYVRTRMPWVHLDDGLITFETFPRNAR